VLCSILGAVMTYIFSYCQSVMMYENDREKQKLNKK
jgi:hypothetical protein